MSEQTAGVYLTTDECEALSEVLELEITRYRARMKPLPNAIDELALVVHEHAIVSASDKIAEARDLLRGSR